MTIEFHGVEFSNAAEAIQHYYASGFGDRVIALNGKYYLTRQAEADRLEAAGVAFVFVFDHECRAGEHRLVSVPVN
jgi:hypothetical protein